MKTKIVALRRRETLYNIIYVYYVNNNNVGTLYAVVVVAAAFDNIIL